MSKFRQNFQRFHHGMDASPLICFLIGGACLIFWACATMIDIQTTEYLALGQPGTMASVQWSTMMQPYMLVTGQAAPVYSLAYVYAWIVELIQLIFALVLTIAVIRLATVNQTISKWFIIVGAFLILMNAYANFNSAPASNLLIQFLIALAVGGFAVVGLPLGIGLIEHGFEELG